MNPFKMLILTVLFGMFFTSCTPYYTWGYSPAIHPEATQAYIYAVMARENGDYETAVRYYDAALRRTYSDKVAKEREETAKMLQK